MGSVYKQPDKREDSSVTAGGRQVSEKGVQRGEKGDSNGGKGLGKKERTSHAMYIYVTITSALRINDAMPCTYSMIIV
jgi:hypothetical protein